MIGSKQRGIRPVLVISDESYNLSIPLVTILPITSRKRGRNIYPNEVLLAMGEGGLALESLILAHQIRTISKDRLIKPIGNLNSKVKQISINEALKIHLNL